MRKSALLIEFLTLLRKNLRIWFYPLLPILPKMVSLSNQTPQIPQQQKRQKTVAKPFLFRIIDFMSETHTTCHGEGRGRSRIRSSHKANLCLSTLLLRRKAQ